MDNSVIDNYFENDDGFRPNPLNTNFLESEKFKDFTSYLCDKDVTLAVVKCRQFIFNNINIYRVNIHQKWSGYFADK